MGWISPTDFVDGGGVWTDEPLAYDENTVTYAYASALKSGWTDYFELTHPVADCDKVRIWVSILIANINTMEVDVFYYGDTWHNIYSGVIITDQFVEYPIGSTQSVTAIRIRFYSTKASAAGCRVHEADFNEVVGVVIVDGTGAGSGVGLATSTALLKVTGQGQGSGVGLFTSTALLTVIAQG